MIKLENPGTINDKVDIAEVTTSEPNSDVKVTVSGWGLKKKPTLDGPSWTPKIPKKLRKVHVKIISRGTCNSSNWWNGLVSDNMICAGKKKNRRKDSCNGDSGGANLKKTIPFF